MRTFQKIQNSEERTTIQMLLEEAGEMSVSEASRSHTRTITGSGRDCGVSRAQSSSPRELGSSVARQDWVSAALFPEK